MAEIERALRRGPAHAREDSGGTMSAEGGTRGTGASGASATRRPSGAGGATTTAAETAADAARSAARRLSDRLAEQGLAEIAYAPVDSPFGELLLAASARGLLRLAFPEEDAEAVLERLSLRISPRIVQAPARLDGARRELEEYFAGRRRGFELPLDWALVGPFGRRVLDAASRIPYGKARTYTQVAAEAGSPRGSRAAGNALGANPVPIVVPCHRVLRGSGALGGYAGGLARKRFLLELEGVL